MTDTTTTEAEIDWGPWGRPLFNDDIAKGLSRVGVIDVGSNSVRMVVFDGAARSPAYFYNEKIMCALGAGLSETGHLSPSGRTRALSAISVPASRFSTVDFPEPLGPVRASTSPGCRVKVRSLSTGRS